MGYLIKELAALSGVSTRTLRYYEEIGLLKPQRTMQNGYRIYAQDDVDLLQQILFYRSLDLSLAHIQKIIHADDYDAISVLQTHLGTLAAKKQQLEQLINTITKTIHMLQGGTAMQDKEKFFGLKQERWAENEAQYGQEARATYGDHIIEESKDKFLNLDIKAFEDMAHLSQQINDTLILAHNEGDPEGAMAQTLCALHKKWLSHYWTTYSAEAHRTLAQTYVDDPRFKAYYDAIAPGGAEFLRDALFIFCQD